MKADYKNFINYLFVPCSLILMEVIFHIYMGLSFKYWYIWGLFDLSFGFLLSFICNSFSNKINNILRCLFTFILGLGFYVEILLKTSTAHYYQFFSAFNMLFENKIFSDYSSVVLKSFLINIGALILMFVPFILSVCLTKKIKNIKKNKKVLIIILVMAIITHVSALGIIHSCTEDNFKELYYSDIEVEQQVENFGLYTMLRLDAKHLLFGVDRDVNVNIEEMGSIKDLQSEIDESTQETTEEGDVVEPEYNVLDINFKDVDNDSVNWLNAYFSSLEPTRKNEYTGMFEGYNVIFITAEGFSGYMIDKELTPTLYKLTHEGFVFNNFYTPLHYTSTTNGECQNLLSLYPKNGEPKVLSSIGKNQLDMPFTLANQLNQLGYKSIGYHFNGEMYGRRLSHPRLGYQWNDSAQLTLEKHQNGNNIWPQSDYYMIEQTIDEYINLKQPFNIYYMTISGHMPYSTLGNTMTYRNWEFVQDLSYSDETKSYIAANLELEKGLTLLVEKLEETGIADKTFIVMAPDHVPYFDLATLEELSGETFGDSEKLEMLDEEGLNFDVYKNSLIIWSASMKEPVVVDKICGQVDILPTVLNLMGVEYDSRLLAGTDILSDSEGLVIFSSKSWKSDKGFYNRYTKEFIAEEGIIVDDNYVDVMKTLVNYKLKATILIMETNYYSLLKYKDAA